ncbi:aldehyde dehydrogenase [Leucosporidium creatinivorum]|uniref:Aldehyde dehydrogenase n=1 Tax=Leucosporidium creatinivorum TaxID=106004 RepID=A0A1Y2F2S7_9BASI|nr:aldehyde dehydrogenase [Leucosporidium creatinivorum]
MAPSSSPAPASLSFKSLPQPVSIPTGLFINNQFVAGRGTPILSIDPSNGKSVLPSSTTVAGASKADVDDAVAAARLAFNTTWGLNVTGQERSRLMHKLANLIEANHETLSLVEALDSGKPIGWSRADVTDMVACLRYYAGWADKIIGQTLEVNNRTKQCFTKHEPIGVVGQVVPWNYPLMMLGWKIAPALCVGCSIVFKPAENTPLSTLKIAELIVEAGFPPGVFNVVNGLGAETGAALASHPDIDKIAFTGSTQTGRAITIAAAQSNLKKVTLELGGKSANIIFPSADLEQATNWAALGVFENAGQSCSAGSRVLVHESIKDEFERRIVEAAEKIELGHPLSETTWQGPQVSEQQYNRIMEHIRIGKEEDKARLLTGGERWGKEGFYIKPTIFTDVKTDARIAVEEIFGPVLVILPFKTEEEAIALANSSEYGLAAAVHSKDADQIGRVSNLLDAGTVWINQYTFTANNVPFGGYKTSGWGRELGSYGLEEYINVKAVHWNMGERTEFPCKL